MSISKLELQIKTLPENPGIYKFYNSEDIMKLTKEVEKNTKIVIYCYYGNSSRKVASFLSEYGFKSVYSLIGGFDAWKSNL